MAVCTQKFPNLVARPIAAHSMGSELIALFEFEEDEGGIAISAEKHYRLVSPEEVTESDLAGYLKRAAD